MAKVVPTAAAAEPGAETPDGANNPREPESKYGQRLEYDPNFQGPVKNRRCTDVLCLGLFLTYLGLWGAVAFFGFYNGNIDKVLYPTDSHGRVCGQGTMASKPYLLFFDLTRCLNPAVLAIGCGTPQVCVKECPSVPFSGLALSVAGEDARAKDLMKPFCLSIPRSAWDKKTGRELVMDGTCPAWVLPSKPYLGRCMPSTPESPSTTTPANDTVVVVDGNGTSDNRPVTVGTLNKALTALGAFLQVRDFFERVLNDASDAWYVLAIGYLMTLALSAIWVTLLRFFAGLMVWLSLVLVFLGVGGLFGFSLFKYLKVKGQAGADASIFQVNYTPDFLKDVLALEGTWLAFTIVLGILFCTFVLLLIALRRRVNLAVALVRQGAKAVGGLWSTLALPVLTFALHVLVFLFFMFVALFLASASKPNYRVAFTSPDSSPVAVETRGAGSLPGRCPPGSCLNPETDSVYALGDACVPAVFNASGCDRCAELVQCQFTNYEGWAPAFWMQFLNLFGLYWALNFVTDYVLLVLAGSYASWYWTPDKKAVSNSVVASSLFNATVFHLGTVAFGSLIIAVIQMARTALSYLEDKLKVANNEVARCLLCCCKCCLWCLEKFMRFINRNAYIVTAMRGTNFCSSASHAFNLIMRNVLRVLVLNKVVDFLLFIGQLVIIIGVGLLAYFSFSGDIPEISREVPTLNYMFTPTIFIVVGAYFITSSFFYVYSMAVDTLFICFLEDLERNDGTPERPYLMSRSLQKVVGRMQKFKASDGGKKD